jgi:hypothetical protein
MRHADWSRLHSHVTKMEMPTSFFVGLGWTMVGVAFSAGFTLFPWLASHSELSDKARLHYAWVTPTLFALIVGPLLIAAMCWKVQSRDRQRNETRRDDILEYMEGICPPQPLVPDRR